MDHEDLFKRQILEKADSSYKKNIYCYTYFLDLAEYSIFLGMRKELSYAVPSVWGGYEEAERVVVRFGSKESLGYPEDFPVKCLHITPVNLKFSESLTHRDCLGAVMGLGIERNRVGDIIVSEGGIWLFSYDGIAEYINENLNEIRHTRVVSEICRFPGIGSVRKTEDIDILVSSPRIDAVISKVYSVSRSVSSAYIDSEKVFINGKVCRNAGEQVSENDKITVRGLGRIRIKEFGNQSRKNKRYIKIELFK